MPKRIGFDGKRHKGNARGLPICPERRILLAADLEAPYACAFTNR